MSGGFSQSQPGHGLIAASSRAFSAFLAHEGQQSFLPSMVAMRGDLYLFPQSAQRTRRLARRRMRA